MTITLWGRSTSSNVQKVRWALGELGLAYEHILVGGRHTTKEMGAKTSLCWLAGDQLHEFAELPSGGDNSYPGFVALSPARGLVSWYSSHEKDESGKTITAIYMAELNLAR